MGTKFTELRDYDWVEVQEMLDDLGIDYALSKPGYVEVEGSRFTTLEEMDEYLMMEGYL